MGLAKHVRGTLGSNGSLFFRRLTCEAYTVMPARGMGFGGKHVWCLPHGVGQSPLVTHQRAKGDGFWNERADGLP
jgi:hypothetical protein